jgi:hypothetical protein
MYYYAGGSMHFFSRYLPTLPQYTAEMEHRLQDLKAMTTMVGRDGAETTVASPLSSDIPTFLDAVAELEKLLVDLHLKDDAANADLKLLREYVPPNATNVPSSAYEVATELMERVWHWLRQQRSKADAADDAELDAAAADDAADVESIADYGIETRLRDIVEKVVGTMSVGELEMRSGAWNEGLGVMISVLNDKIDTTFSSSDASRNLLRLLTAESSDTGTGDSTKGKKDQNLDGKQRLALAYVVPDNKHSVFRYHPPVSSSASVLFTSPHVQATVVNRAAEVDMNAFLWVMNGLRSNRHRRDPLAY